MYLSSTKGLMETSPQCSRFWHECMLGDSWCT